MFADPALDHTGDRLHRALDVHAALEIARQVERVGNFSPETVAVRQPHDTEPADEAIRMVRELRQQRVDFAGTAEERHLDAAGIVLVDKHADMAAAFKGARKPQRRVEA